MNQEVTQLLEQIGIQGLIKLAPLKNKTVSELAIDDLRLLTQTLGVTTEINDELFHASIAILRGHGIDKAADIIQSPESVQQLLSLIRGKPAAAARIIECPHCFGYFFDPMANGQKASSK